MRLVADFENFRKRTASEKEAMKATVRGDTISELLPLVSEPRVAGRREGSAEGGGSKESCERSCGRHLVASPCCRVAAAARWWGAVASLPALPSGYTWCI